jgi:hypothetical protein
MLSVTTSGEDHMTEKGGAHGKGGLVPGHCYSVINVSNADGN